MPSVFAGSQTYPEQPVRPVLTIGNFDGLHRGHRHLIRALTAASIPDQVDEHVNFLLVDQVRSLHTRHL